MVAETVDRETGEIIPQAIPQEDERADFADARLNPKFVQTRQGRPFVAYPGLLDLLHQLSEGFFAVDTEVVQLPAADNGHTAVCIARVRIFDPQDADVVRRCTSGIGDADPSNVSAQMRPHLLRMAETRAKARALRDAVNVGMAALEELGPEEAQQPERRVEQVHEPTERIMIEGRAWTRAQVEAGYKKVLEEARAAGLGLGQMDPSAGSGQAVAPIERLPLAVLAGKAQELRRRLEAKAGAAK